MKIIKYRKLNKNTYEIYLKEKKEPITLHDDTILYFNLLTKKEIDAKDLNNILIYNDGIDCYYKSIKYLSNKMRSKNEVIAYLKQNGYNDKLINDVITRLENDGFIDDSKYIQAFVNDQINLTLNGPNKIKNLLYNQKVDSDKILLFINEIDDDIWNSKIKKIIDKRLKLNKDSRNSFILKTSNYLQNLGYNSSMYMDYLNSIELDDTKNFKVNAEKTYDKLSKIYQDDKLYYKIKNQLYTKGYDLNLINEFIQKLKEEK